MKITANAVGRAGKGTYDCGHRSRALKTCRGPPAAATAEPGAPIDSEQNDVDYLRALRLIAKCIAHDPGKSLAEGRTNETVVRKVERGAAFAQRLRLQHGNV